MKLSLKQLCLFTLCGGKDNTIASTPEYFYEKFKGTFEKDIKKNSAFSSWLAKDIALWNSVLPKDLYTQLIAFKQSFYGKYLSSDMRFDFYSGNVELLEVSLVVKKQCIKRIYVDNTEWKYLEIITSTDEYDIDIKNDPCTHNMGWDYLLRDPDKIEHVSARLQKQTNSKKRKVEFNFSVK